MASNSQITSLSRMIARFHRILITPDSDTEARLCASSSERAKLDAVSFDCVPRTRMTL